MSYSRWSYSCWYAFSTVNTINNEPTLDINCEDTYALSDLKENKDRVLQKYREMKFDNSSENAYTEKEIQELSQIIDLFIKDYKNE